MKNLLLFGLAITVLIALFGDGGLEVSPTVSPALEFKPNVSYAPDRSVTTNNIETNIEHQTVIVQSPASVQAGAVGGSSTVDPAYNLCQPADGETIVQKPDSKGACVVQDASGNRYFINAAGVKWLLGNAPTTALQAPDNGLSLDQLQAAFLRNGGSLPWFWDTRSEAAQMDWLKEQSETWK